METEAGAAPTAGPRRGLIVALVLVAAVAAAIQFWPATNPAGPASAPSKPRRTSGKVPDVIEPSDLVVRIDELQAQRPDAGPVERNPFRFQPKAPPPPPPGPPVTARPAPQPTEPVGPPQPPPIPLKFIGIVEPRPGDKVAAFSDCRYTFRGREGDVIDGRYRLVKIGVESVIMEYADGRGRTTIRLSGQECVGR